MNVLQEEIIEGVSLFTVSMNRTEFLLKALPTWKTALDYSTLVYEIIILDWGSEPSIIIDDPKIKLIRIERKKWILSIAFNIAARFTRYNKLLKIDSDIMLSPTFFDNIKQLDSCFFTGNWETARNENERHTNGTCYMLRSTFFAVNGYNELIQTYGYDDTDLYNRMSIIDKKLDLDQTTLSHIPHSNTIRSSLNVQHEVYKNSILCSMFPWKGKMLDITRISQKDNYITIEVDDIIPCLSYEAKEAIDSLTGYKRKFYIEVINGLGNRLRAFASAGVLAIETKRDLVLIWDKSHHCEASFQDLFDYDDLRVTLRNKGISFTIQSSKPHLSDVSLPLGEHCFLPSDRDIFITTTNVISNPLTNWNKEADFLNLLKYSSDVNRLLGEYDYINKTYIGVHIRMGQEGHEFDSTDGWAEYIKQACERWRSASHYSVFINYMKNIKSSKFFLCSDNKSVYDEVIANIPDVTYITRNYFDRSSEQVKYALVEMILLSRTGLILGSNWSTFTEIARKIGNVPTKLAGIDF